MELLDGINGKVLACADLDRATNGANTFVDVAGRTWTRTAGSTLGGATGLLVLNGSISGGTLAAIDDVTRLPKMAPAIGAQLFMVNLGHNALGGDITTDYQKLINDVLVRYPTAEPFVIVQNPQTTDAPGFATHTEHMNQVRALAQAQHYRYADVYSKFIANPSYEADWMNGPGAHPNAAGYQVEADVVRQRICRR
jgi:lysophospholipase L1-like esterase